MDRQVMRGNSHSLLEPALVDDKLLDNICQTIVTSLGPIRIILFGSRARGNYRADSDIDLFIEMESDKLPFQRSAAVSSLFPDRWWGMDILVYTPDELEASKESLFSIVPMVMKEGITLYSRSDAA